MKIAIPSYNRPNTITTINTLIRHGIKEEDIYLFLGNQEQYDLYKPNTPIGVNMVIGEVGICNIRNFITNYFEEGEIIVSMDDDLADFKIKQKTLIEVITHSIEYLKNSPYHLLGFPPTCNEFFAKGDGYKVGLYFAVGCFYLVKVDKTIILSNNCEDIELNLLSFSKYGGIIRCSDIVFKTKFFAAGGCNLQSNRNYLTYYSGFSKLIYQYPHLLGFRYKKIKYYRVNEAPNLVMRNKKSYEIPKIIQFPKIDKSFFQPLLNILTRVTLSRKQNEDEAKKSGKYTGSFRKNFPAHRADVFGMVKLRPKDWQRNGGSMFAISAASNTKTNLYEELKRIGDIIVPFEYSSILINNNTVSGKHLDASNVGQSLLVSIGDYEGCNIMIEGKKYDAKYQPLIFNGSEMEHWNTDDLVGNKYSIVYYDILKKRT